MPNRQNLLLYFSVTAEMLLTCHRGYLDAYASLWFAPQSTDLLYVQLGSLDFPHWMFLVRFMLFCHFALFCSSWLVESIIESTPANVVCTCVCLRSYWVVVSHYGFLKRRTVTLDTLWHCKCSRMFFATIIQLGYFPCDENISPQGKLGTPSGI